MRERSEVTRAKSGMEGVNWSGEMVVVVVAVVVVVVVVVVEEAVMTFEEVALNKLLEEAVEVEVEAAEAEASAEALTPALPSSRSGDDRLECRLLLLFIEDLLDDGNASSSSGDSRKKLTKYES